MMWTWTRAMGSDIDAIVETSNHYIRSQVESIWTIDLLELARNVATTVVNQFYNPYTELLMVAKSNDRIIAYCWVKRGERAPWSGEEICAPRVAHVDMTLPVRSRVKLIKEMIGLWEVWALECNIPIVNSSTMRDSQDGFLRIHQQMGYDVRGSVAYKRLTKETK